MHLKKYKDSKWPKKLRENYLKNWGWTESQLRVNTVKKIILKITNIKNVPKMAKRMKFEGELRAN